MQKDTFENPFKSVLKYSKDQQKGLIVLFALIISLQLVYYFVDFSQPKQQNAKEQRWLALQTTIDSQKAQTKSYVYKIYPFNPNFITDFKGAKLGMSVAQIDRLLAFRKLGKFANSPQEFQQVTGVSDSLLAAMSPYFKFPDWVKNKQKGEYAYQSFENYPKKEALKVVDINEATKDDLMKISGIGDAISERILKQKELLGGFVSMEQMTEIWGLSTDVVDKLNQYFKIKTLPKINKININSASIKELSQFYYFKGTVPRNIVVYRSMNGNLKIEDLTNIKSFPVDKIKIIALYLEF